MEESWECGRRKRCREMEKVLTVKMRHNAMKRRDGGGRAETDMTEIKKRPKI